MHKTSQAEANMNTNSTKLDKRTVLELETIEKLQDNWEMLTNNEAMLLKGNKTEISQEHSESELTDELAIKRSTDQELVTAGPRTIKHGTNNLIDMDIKGFTTVSYKKSTTRKKE
ncbi:21658_t:CDS:2, partial [Gigaspora margarita]